MGRRAGSRNRETKKRKQGELMYDSTNVIKPLGNVTYLSNQPKIIDKKSTSHFGILLSTQQSIEEFQKKSGMLKAFTTEYQYHYWALVARVRLENETLDIAIPTVMFNYTQEVNGAAVDFHLNDVEEASNRNAPVAEAIAGVLVESTFGKYLVSLFGEVEWMNVPMNTCHVHPGNLSTFSGTDYSKTINDPGICFPLSEPREQASFSSIICHQGTDGNIGKVVRTEYRFATRDGLDINYLHGTCLAYWKGYMVKGYKNKLPLIKAIFSGKEYDEKLDTPKPAYINTDGSTIVLENNELLNSIIDQFNKLVDELNFSPYTEDILAERIVSMKSKYTDAYGWNGHQYKNPAKTHTTTSTSETISNPQPINQITGALTLVALREKLIQAGYASSTVYQWAWHKCEQMYQNVLLAQQRTTPVVAETTVSETPEKVTIDEMIHFLLDSGLTANDIRGKDSKQIEIMFDEFMQLELEYQEFEESVFNSESTIVKPEPLLINNANVRFFLLSHHLSESYIDTLSNDEVSIILEEFNW